MHLNLGHLKNRHLISLTGQNLITSTKPKCGGYHQQDRQIICSYCNKIDALLIIDCRTDFSNHSRVLEINSFYESKGPYGFLFIRLKKALLFSF